MSIWVVPLLVGCALAVASGTVFTTITLLAAFGEIRYRPVFLLVLLPMFVGLTLMTASNVAIVGNPFR